MPAAFHTAVSRWLERAFEAPTPAQEQAWPAIQAGRHTLIAAPTGSGKTLAAFLAAIDLLVWEGLERGGLQDETYILYVSPLKALSNDIRRNLEAPLAGIRDELRAMSLPELEIRTSVRTGDTPQHERQSMRRRPPHIMVTTPESLYILLGSESGRAMLASVRSVIVDEIHAMVGSKRGLHLALSLERLEALAGRRLTRIGLSATQRPIEEVARFLVGSRQLRIDGEADCAIIDTGHIRRRDLQIEVPAAPLEAVMSGDVWTQVYDRLAQLAGEHRTTLIFVNTRRHAERVARHLSERMGETQVAAHHGSMAKELRLAAESRLKRGELKALVATASLELGIDIGEVDLVCQLGSPRSIAALLQRVGRSGHSLGGTPKGRLFPLSRDDLVECAALLDCVRRGELDHLHIPAKPLDVLAQQIVAEVAAREWGVDELFALLRGAYPYRGLQRAELDDVVRMLADGFTTRRGRRGALVHYDAVNRKVRGRRGARLTALTSGGTIPDTADYKVLLEPQSQLVGTINEDFAVESLQGDIFQLGNSSYRILRVEQGTVRVEDAHGQPPSIPFWLGEAPGRSDELSQGVSRLRHEVESRLDGGLEAAAGWLENEVGVAGPAAVQAAGYLAAAHAALGALPTHGTVVLERFFDEAGGMQLVVHSPFGSRVNRAWGLALRKRFCRSFNFELQAAATEDAIVLSLTTAHSFELAEVARYLHSNTVRPLLVQALCAAPMFPARWRWSAAIALALPRFRGGRKVPAPLARMAAEDLLASVFPDQVACAENLSGELEIPDHPLVRQAVRDCLEDAMDIEGLEGLLRGLESGAIRVVARDLTEPSPLALEVLSARPYAFLDDAPLEERRTQAVLSRRWLDPEAAGDLGALDPAAIARVREEAWPDASDADELHDALCWLTFMTEAEIRKRADWTEWAGSLAADRRAACLRSGGATLWIAAERLPLLQMLLPDARPEPAIEAPAEYRAKRQASSAKARDEPDSPWSTDEALLEIARGRLQGLGPVSAATLARPLGVSAGRMASALAALQAEGSVMQGRFTADAPEDGEWCERGLLARIHRYTVKRLRAEIEPVEPRDLLRFLLEWQRAAPRARMEGPDAVAAVLAQLEGFEAPAGAWETEILPARINEYDPAWLDEQCLAGRFVWTRLARRRAESGPVAGPVRGTPIALLGRRHLRAWAALAGAVDAGAPSAKARRVLEHLSSQGASFFDEIVEGSGLLPAQAEEGLAELVALGLVNSDSFGGLRALLVPSERRRSSTGPRRRRRALFGMDSAGRWALVRREQSAAPERTDAGRTDGEIIELVARGLLRRWGVVFWRLIAREADWLPPWRELLFCYRRLEARGEIRGGRFVAGLSGEQFAAPEAVGLLREVRRRPREGEWVSLSAADPLNLLGLLTPGPRLPALAGNRVLYRDGLPLATLAGGEVRVLEALDAAAQWEARNMLLRRHVPAALADID
ncbi:MAG TPA: DEAD/DEAH box helicase [Steroidobacteraceae bacterium]|nr:DEAD/DEAH box helicase [Steroidobacteraceae bacterium]